LLDSARADQRFEILGGNRSGKVREDFIRLEFNIREDLSDESVSDRDRRFAVLGLNAGVRFALAGDNSHRILPFGRNGLTRLTRREFSFRGDLRRPPG
jgi:hypothetical protein